MTSLFSLTFFNTGLRLATARFIFNEEECTFKFFNAHMSLYILLKTFVLLLAQSRNRLQKVRGSDISKLGNTELLEGFDLSFAHGLDQ